MAAMIPQSIECISHCFCHFLSLPLKAFEASDEWNSRRYQSRPSQDSFRFQDGSTQVKINLDMDAGSDSNALKSSLTKVVHIADPSTSIQIDKERKSSQLSALRILYIEGGADGYSKRKLARDLSRTQRRDSDLFRASCCCGISWSFFRFKFSSQKAIFRWMKEKLFLRRRL